MKTLRLLALALAAILLSSAPGFAASIRGVWEFSNPAALGAGQTLPGGGASPTLIVEGTVPTHTASLGDGTTALSGVITTVVGPANRLRLTHGIAPNGGSATLVRQYSLLFDVFSPAASRAAWRSFFQTKTANDNDGDYFIRPDNNQMGTAELGYTTAELDEAHWARVVIVVDLPSVKVYVNGALFHTHFNQDLNGRYALESQLLLFADENGENAALNVGAVAMWSGALTGSEVAALSGPGGGNIGYNGLPPEIVVEQPAGTELGAGGVFVWGYNGNGQTTVPAGAQSGVIAIAAGDYHTLALKNDGTVLGWGFNGNDQATAPAAAQSGVTAIAGGSDHSVVLKSNGSVFAWGFNNHGQTTVPAAAQSGVTAIAAGGEHTVALKSNGSVLAWGYNILGQTTVPAGAQSGVIAIAAGKYHTVALKSDGSVLAWGDNDFGQTTVPAGAQSGVTAIAAGGYHTVALKSDGSVVAWGYNADGQTTVPAGAQSGVTAIAAGNSYTLALKSDGSVLAWGNNFAGQTAVPAGAQTSVTAIAAGLGHAVALVTPTPTVAFASQVTGSPSAAKSFVVKNTGTGALALTSVSVTGGQAGDFTVNTTGMLASVPAAGQTTFSVTFTPSALGPRATTLRIVNDDANENPFDIALTGTGADTTPPETSITSANPTPTNSTTRTITFTGMDNVAVTSFEGRLDGAAFETVTSPVSLSGLADGSHTYDVRARDAAGNVDATPASVTWVVETPEIAVEHPAGTDLKRDGSVVAFGDNEDGQTTVPAGAQSGVTAIAAGFGHTVALKADGSVLAWGGNGNGQTTVPVAAQSGVTAIAAGDSHTVALKGDGSVLAWGNNNYGQTTVPAGAQSGVTAIAASFYQTVALKSDGSVLAWGYNGYGQTTVPVAAQSGVVAIAAGQLHTVALKNDGSVVAWGYNADGQTTVPTAAQTGVIAIAAGYDHTVALKSNGTVLAWGSDGVGQTTVPTGAQSGVTAIAAGAAHTVARKSDGTVLAWGSNFDGQTTVPAAAQSGVTAIAAGAYYTVVIVANAPTVAFASQTLGSPSAAKSFVVKNTGNAPLALTSVSVTGGQAGDFTVNTTGMLASVPAGGQTTFSVTFTPSALGNRATTLRIVNDDDDENPLNIALIGTGTVDTTPPETSITSANPTPVSSTTRTITFTGTDNVGVTSFEGRLDGAAFATVTSPVSLSGLGDGSHTYQVRARDTAGNVDATPASVTWVVTTAPEIVVEPAGTPLLSVVAWGYNDDGQTTVPAGAQSGVTALAAGYAHTVALKSDGSVLAWGNDSYGQSTVPAGAQSGVTAIAAAETHTVALKSNGSVLAWGDNSSGQTTVPAGAQSGVTAIAAGNAHTVALKSDGSVLAWGGNNFGETTVPVGAQSGVVAIAAGEFHTVALKSDGSVLAWGNNGNGQTTVPAGAQSGVIAIAAGYDHTVALKSNGSVLAWGHNGNGQTTVPAGAQSGVTAIAAGFGHTVALKSDGSMLAWGSNGFGQTTVPAGAQTGVVAIAAGGFHTVALVASTPTVAFASQALGSPSAAKSFVVKNTGTAALALSGVSVTGGQAGDFTVNTTGMLASVPAGGQTTFSVTFTPSAPGARATTLRIVNDDPDENPFDIALTGTGQGVFPAWATANGVANDPQALGANGLKNLLNFAFAIHPGTGGAGPLQYAGTLAGGGTITATGLPITIIEPGDMRALFVRRKDRVAAGLTYTPQFSPTLATWQASAEPTVLADDGVNQIVSVPYPALGPGETSTFFRVVVSLAP